MIPDRFFYPIAALVVAALIAAALVYPRGQGAPRPVAPAFLAHLEPKAR